MTMFRGAIDNGPHAMATLGLHLLSSDHLIRQAIKEMEIRTGRNPWHGEERHVEDVDLVLFFKLAREKRVDFFDTTVEKHAALARSAGKSAA